MVSIQDSSVGMAVEAAYGTNTTVARWLEHLGETFDFNKSIKQGQGMRVGARVDRSGRRVVTSAMGGGDLPVEGISKGLGLLWQACLGSSVSTLVSGSTFQQVHTLGDNPASLTIQTGDVRIDPVTGAGTVDAETYIGCMVDSWEFDFTNDDIAQLKATFNAKDVTTATAYAAPSYPTTPNLFHFANASIAGGTLTPPTATALAAGSTTIADIRGGSITVNNNLIAPRLNMGGGGRQAKPIPTKRSIAVKFDAEYDTVAYRDAVLNETPMMLIINYTAGALSSGVEQLQIVIPEIKFDSELPKTNGTDLIIQPMAGVGLDNLVAAQPIWVVCRTADAAL